MVCVLGLIAFSLTDWYTNVLYTLHIWAMRMDLPFILRAINESCFKSHYKRRDQFLQTVILYVGQDNVSQRRSWAVGLRDCPSAKRNREVPSTHSPCCGESASSGTHPLLGETGSASAARRAKSIAGPNPGEWQFRDWLHRSQGLAALFEGSSDPDGAWYLLFEAGFGYCLCLMYPWKLLICWWLR